MDRREQAEQERYSRQEGSLYSEDLLCCSNGKTTVTAWSNIPTGHTRLCEEVARKCGHPVRGGRWRQSGHSEGSGSYGCLSLIERVDEKYSCYIRHAVHSSSLYIPLVLVFLTDDFNRMLWKQMYFEANTGCFRSVHHRSGSCKLLRDLL